MTRIVKWEGAPQMSTGASVPVLESSEGVLFVAYITHDDVEVCSGSNSEQWAVVSFEVVQYTFGYPNDEALSAHTLFEFGLEPYTFNLVESSPSVKDLADRNGLLFSESSQHFVSLKHWIVTFHDETLEIIGRAMKSHGVLEASSGIEAIEHFRSST